jgi:hypothetical protein
MSARCRQRSRGRRLLMHALRQNGDTRKKSLNRMNLTLVGAFGRFGATPVNRLRALSAIAADGAVVLNCSQSHFAHPSPGVLRYEDKLSREPARSKDVLLLGQHLTRARDEDLLVRMVVAFSPDVKRAAASGYHVRPDLVGKVVEFDGDHFKVDFTRVAAPTRSVAASGARR